MDKFKVITVLDYESGKVTQYNVDKWEIDTEDVQSNCFILTCQLVGWVSLRI